MLIVLWIQLATGLSFACSCDRLLTSLPSGPKAPVPANTRPVLVTPGPADEVTLTDGNNVPVAVDRVTVNLSSSRLVELRPRLPLSPGRYWWRHTDQDGDQVVAGRLDIIGGMDATPPPPVAGIRARPVWRWCDGGGWSLLVRASVPSRDDLLLLVYEGERFDQVVNLGLGEAQFLLGRHTPCGSSAVSLRGTEVNLVVRDAAGNVSPSTRLVARAWLPWRVD